MTHEQIQELNNLSMAVFRSKSKWRKMVEQGVAELVVEDTTRLTSDGTETTVKTAKMHVGAKGGEVPQYTLQRYTPESVKEFMLKVIYERQLYFDAIRKVKEKEEEDLKKELQKQAVEEASGTSV